MNYARILLIAAGLVSLVSCGSPTAPPPSKPLRWSVVTIPIGEALSDVAMAGPRTGVAVGPNGRLVRTSDGGLSWTIPVSNALADLHAVAFHDASTGIAVGDAGHVIRTTDGGLSWRKLPTGIPDLGYRDVCFATRDSIYLVGAGGVLGGGAIVRSIDGGTSWNLLDVRVDVQLNAVHFVGSAIGTAVGNNGAILHTTDGGTTWARQHSSLGTANTLTGVHCIDASRATIVGGGAGLTSIIHTTNGGAVWIRRNVNTRKPLQDLSFFDRYHGVAVGIPERSSVPRTEEPAGWMNRCRRSIATGGARSSMTRRASSWGSGE